MIILTYHKINDVVSFTTQIDYLARKSYNILSLQDFISKHEQRAFKQNDVLLTFDDGDHSVLDNALPVLKRFQMPAVLFVITGLIGTSLPFWWDEIHYYTGDWQQVLKAKLIPEEDRLRLLEGLRSGSDRPPLRYRQLTFADLKLLERNNISIANHSHTHPMFDKISEHKIKEEFSLSSTLLNQHGFVSHNVFAYPNGNFTNKTEEALVKEGLKFAFLFDHKLYIDLHPFRISRLSVNDNTPLWKFKYILSGLHSATLPLVKTIYRILR